MHVLSRTSFEPLAPSELILRPDGSLYHLGILPENIATKIIIVGDPERVAIVSDLFDSIEFRIASREFVIHTGSYRGKRITVVSSGIGVDNIDILINELDAAVNVDLNNRTIKQHITQLEIVRIGTCGSLQRAISPGSFVASTFAFATDGVPFSYNAQLDKKEKNLSNALLQKFSWLNENKNFYVVEGSDDLIKRIAGDMQKGITATANGFYGPQGRSIRIQSAITERINDYSSFAHDGLQITNFEMEAAGIYAMSALLGHKALTVCVVLANRVTKEFHSNPSASIEKLITTVLQRF